MNRLFTIIFGLFFVVSCNNQHDKNNRLFEKNNSKNTASNKIISKKWFSIKSISYDTSDTLYVITCSDFIYYPFGLIDRKEKINLTELKKFEIVGHKESKKDESYSYFLLKYKSSKLILLFDKPYQSIYSYIINGKINDCDIKLRNSISVGMNLNKFMDLFFESYPRKKYKVVIFESCKLGNFHVYNFENNILKSINFDSFEQVRDLDF